MGHVLHENRKGFPLGLKIFRWEQLPENQTSTQFFDWKEFTEEFRKEFCPAQADSVAINTLESTSYFQKTRSLDAYLDQFQDLITDSGYSDPKTVVVKFWRGLNTSLQNAVATMTYGRPTDSDPEGWYKATWAVDQNRLANEAFQASKPPIRWRLGLHPDQLESPPLLGIPYRGPSPPFRRSQHPPALVAEKPDILKEVRSAYSALTSEQWTRKSSRTY